MATVPAYWWTGLPNRPFRNFGDMLTPLLLQHLCRVDPVLTSVVDARVVGVGSVLEHLPTGWDGYIAGSGKLRESSRVDLSRAKVLALRGPLSARGVKADCALGDPGLLATDLVSVEKKKFGLGIVPHWSDRKLAVDRRFISSAYSYTVIDPTGDPLDVMRRIGECHKIVSSSLHGIIVADAFGIPRRFQYTDQFDREGGTFKFRDYNASVGVPFEVGKVQTPHRYKVEDRQHELYDAFYYLGAVLRSQK